MEIILGAIVALAFLIIGIFIGNKTKLTKEVEESFQKAVKEYDKKRSPVGVVRRPTQYDIDKKKDPFVKKVEEGKDAMRETLELIVKNASQDKKRG